MIVVSHKIQLIPNNKQKTYFEKAFGCSRFAYNWGLAEWKRRYEAGEKFSIFDIKKSFNKIKREQFPFVLEVTKYATQMSFIYLNKAFTSFFSDYKKGIISFPKFKKKRDNFGSFYIGGDQIALSWVNLNSKTFKKIPHNKNFRYQYLRVPNLGWVKMSEKVRFDGKIYNVVITRQGDKYFASFTVCITEEEYNRTHCSRLKNKGKAVGIDVGIKSTVVLSDGLSIANPKPLKKYERKIKKISRKRDKRVYARTKIDRLRGVKNSANYTKLNKKLYRVQRKVANIRKDFMHKLTTILVSYYEHIVIEDLYIKGMAKNRCLAKPVGDAALGTFNRYLEYKSSMKGVVITKADRYYASSKICSVCGHKDDSLKLSQRTYRCSCCGTVIDRDYNASLNLLSLIKDKGVGVDCPELTPVDLTALISLFAKNGITTSKIESGIQHKS